MTQSNNRLASPWTSIFCGVTAGALLLTSLSHKLQVFHASTIHRVGHSHIRHLKDNSLQVVVANTTEKDDDDKISVSIIPILSGQRSSSTFLAYKIMDTIPCHLSINEVLFKDEGQSGDAWKVEAEQLGFAEQPNAKGVDPDTLADFVISVGTRQCKAKLDKDPFLAQKCHNHCWVNYKHFHLHLDAWQHQMMWNSLIEKTSTAQTTIGFAMAILERDVKERWRSTWYAEHSGDWEIMGDANHREKVQAAEIPPMEKEFWFEHVNWYEMIRGFAKITNKLRQQKNEPLIPIMEFEYSTIVKQPVEYIQRQIQEQIGQETSTTTTDPVVV